MPFICGVAYIQEFTVFDGESMQEMNKSLPYSWCVRALDLLSFQDWFVSPVHLDGCPTDAER